MLGSYYRNNYLNFYYYCNSLSSYDLDPRANIFARGLRAAIRGASSSSSCIVNEESSENSSASLAVVNGSFARVSERRERPLHSSFAT